MNKETELLTAPNCKSIDNKHILDDCQSPYIAKCVVCNERFVLVSETILRKLGLGIIPRQVLKS